ncbi:DUF3923 family protein [Bacillus paralicheniformis]|uniref:DUF3923 family protein n=1 Tax=Bacillus paralicheniformis TaxID=1648923 RepID=UPI000CDABABA|nr:DUF3923 family protein [Bacillus paralicheniformis]POO77987.1 DUF3923 domain-containing protein [Bacillus sp. MBGLi97]
MKKRWIFWWICNIFWMAVFVMGTALVWLRDVDGAGVTQTLELKLIAFIVLLIAFIFPFIIQVVWLIVNLKTGSSK